MSTILFAADTTLLFKNKSFETLIFSPNNELIKYREWAIANGLSLNVNINRPIPYQPQIAYDQQILNVKEECTFLCVSLDNKLKINNHIQIIGKKIGRSIVVTYKLKNFVPFNILRNLYYTLNNLFFSIVTLFGQIPMKFILSLCL